MFPFKIDDFQATLFVALIVIFLSWALLSYLKTPKNLPSGPWGLPIVGYKFFLGKRPQETVANMRKIYGDLIRVNMGNEYVIFLTSFNAIKEAFAKQGDTFSLKPDHLIQHKGFEEAPGILRSSGELWSDLRRFSLSTLRDFGFGKSSLEPQIMDEIQHFLKALEATKAQPIKDMKELLRKSVTNVICVIMTGKRLDYEDKVIQNLMSISKEHVTRAGIDRLLFLIPKPLRFQVLLDLLGIKSPGETALKMLKIMQNLVEELDAKHEAGVQDNFIDAWLTESKNTNSQSKNLTSKLNII